MAWSAVALVRRAGASEALIWRDGAGAGLQCPVGDLKRAASARSAT